jgi:type II secretory pathway component PulK
MMSILTLLLYAFLGEMQVEYALAGGFGEQKKAEQLAWSAVDAACAALATDAKPWHELIDPWSDDEVSFFEVELGDGAYSVFHPLYDDTGRVLWGVEDEASKVNLNYAPKELLLKLPRVTEEIADSIIDWRDADTNPGASGAEDSYYGGLNPPYKAKNQPFETIEELLYVRGMTFEILYGEDANLNGRLDPNENDGTATPPDDDRDGVLDPGLYALTTVWSVDRNSSLDDQPRINVNTAPPDQLRQAGLQANEIQSILQARGQGGPFRSLAHLLGILPAPRFKQVVDRLTVFDGERVPGQVNINTAPKVVLLALPGITEEIAVRLLDYRSQPGVDLSNIGWLTDVTQPQEFQQFAGYVTVRSNQFRIHAVGRIGTPYASLTAESEVERPGAFRRMVAVFDRLAQPRPRLVYWKDASRFGMPYDPSDGPNP